MALWVVETTDVPARQSNESDWREHGAYGPKATAMYHARSLRKYGPPKRRVRVRIDYARGGMTG